MQIVVIMRHGDAEGFNKPDHLRELTPLGRQEVAQVASHLTELGIQQLWHSPFVRAQQTAKIVIDNTNASKQISVHQGITPAGNAAVVAEELKLCSENLLLVSHMPFVSSLVAELTGELTGFKTAQCVLLSRENQQDDFTLSKVITPHGR